VQERTEEVDVKDHGVVEVHLEEFGAHSWVKSLLNLGSYGSAQYRFVARPPGEAHRADDHVATGATFPLMRAQNLDDVASRDPWSAIARDRLEELDGELRAKGWTRRPAGGKHWWSRSYVA
jgi:hypothetical protein